MNKLELSNYNIHWSLMGGQAHTWEFDGQNYWGVTSNKLIKIQIPEPNAYDLRPTTYGVSVLWQTYPKNDDFEFISNYLNLNSNYGEQLKIINKDEHINSAIKKYPGLRVLKQNFEETLIQYMFSANNNIPSIRRSLKNFRIKYGKKIEVEGQIFHLLPYFKDFENASEQDLRETKMGFRSKYLMNARDAFLAGDLFNVEKDNAEDARIKLLKINGIGEKIADCILIYGLGHDHITPLDVWGKRIVIDLYKQNPKAKYEEHRKWITDYFEGYAGLAGQFLYEYLRNK